MGYRKDFYEKGQQIEATLLSYKELIIKGETTRQALSTACNCSTHAIDYHLKNMNIAFDSVEYTVEQEEFIKSHHSDYTEEEIAELFNKEFGLHKSPEAIRFKARKLGTPIPHYRRWTREQEDWLRNNYSTGYTQSRLAIEFNKRFNTNLDGKAIQLHATRCLKLKREKGSAWNKYKVGEVMASKDTRRNQMIYYVKIDNVPYGDKVNYETIPQDVYENNAIAPNSALAYGITKRLLRSVETDIREATPKKVKGKSNILTSRKIKAYMLAHQEEILNQQLSISDVAKELGVSYSSVQENRTKLNFPALAHSTEGLDEFIEEHREEIVARKITDKQLAEEFGVAVNTIISHRVRLGIRVR